MQRIRWFLIISGVLVLMVFSLSNTKSVSVQMPLLFHAEIPLSMLLAIAGLIGFMVGALWTAWMLRRRKSKAVGTVGGEPAVTPAEGPPLS